MSDLPNRIQCQKCGANNFPSSEMCWKCGQRLREQPEPPQHAQQQAQYIPPPPTYDPAHVEPGSPFPRYRSGRSADNLITLGYVLGGISYPAIFCCCCVSPLLSLAGVILGVVSESQGDKRGRWVILVGGISLLLFVGASVLYGSVGHWSSSTSFPGGGFRGGFRGGFPRGFPMPGP